MKTYTEMIRQIATDNIDNNQAANNGSGAYKVDPVEMLAEIYMIDPVSVKSDLCIKIITKRFSPKA